MKHQFTLVRAVKVLQNSESLRLMFLAWLSRSTLDPVQYEAFMELIGPVDIEPMLELAEKAELSHADIRVQVPGV